MRPAIAERINVPGEVIDVNGDTMFTRDRIWGGQFIETALARVTVAGASAHLRNYQRFPNRVVDSIVLDEHRVPVVMDDLIWGRSGYDVFNQALNLDFAPSDQTASPARARLAA